MERRRTRRIASVHPVTIDFPEGDNPLADGPSAQTLDISLCGAAVEITSSSPFSIPVGRELFLTITLGEKAISALGRVVYERPRGERQAVVGVCFIELSPDDRHALLDSVGE